jgi:hypothetical protein
VSSARVALALTLTLVAGCRRPAEAERRGAPPEPADPEAAIDAGSAASVSESAPGPDTESATSTGITAEPASTAESSASGCEACPAGEESLETEEREMNPRSETVKLKLWVTPAANATIYWGAKKLGSAPLELERPRGSGPMDLVVKAPGYLPYRTRLFTDRDDKLTVRLVRPQNAAGLLGYKRSAGALPPAENP